VSRPFEPNIPDEHATEIGSGRRFSFGENWTRFLDEVKPERILLAVQSLQDKLGAASLDQKRFLDVGSGSGLFSLAARRLGAIVHSFDFDPQSVACTAELKRRYFPEDSQWSVARGSALDTGYITSLGQWDIVYAWGVLHHTGRMWLALEHVGQLVAPGGELYLAIYNDQGRASVRWLWVKQAYNRLPSMLRWLVTVPAFLWLWLPTTMRDLWRGRPFETWRTYASGSLRGMSPWRDLVDWVGGLPFEVARPEQIFRFFRDRGFLLLELRTCAGGLGCNEYVFRHAAGVPGRAADQLSNSA